MSNIVVPQLFNEHVLNEFPNEAVAVLDKDGNYQSLSNIAESPRNSFAIAPRDMIIHKPTAILHSHTYPMDERIGHRFDLRTPSLSDYNGQQATNIPWAIVSTDGENISSPLIFPQSMDRELTLRPFIWLINDCGTLIRDYYWQKFNIEINYDPPDWTKKIPDEVYMKAIKNSNVKWERIDLKHIQEGDVLIMSMDGVLNHAGIYTEGKILLQMYHQISNVYDIGKFASHINMAVRYIPDE